MVYFWKLIFLDKAWDFVKWKQRKMEDGRLLLFITIASNITALFLIKIPSATVQWICFQLYFNFLLYLFRLYHMCRPFAISSLEKKIMPLSKDLREILCFYLYKDLENYWENYGIHVILKRMSALMKCCKLLFCAVKRNFKSLNRVIIYFN